MHKKISSRHTKSVPKNLGGTNYGQKLFKFKQQCKQKRKQLLKQLKQQ